MDDPDNTTDRSDTPERPPLPMRGMLVWLLLLLIFFSLFHFFAQVQDRPDRIPYHPDFVRLVEGGRIDNCEIVLEVSGLQYVAGEMKPEEGRTKRRKFRTDIVVTDDLIQWLKDYNVPFRFRPQNPLLWQMVTSAIPFLVLMGLVYFLVVRQMRMVGRGAMSFGKSRAKLLARSRNRITFEDVAGIDEAREEVEEIIEFLKNPKKFQRLGGRIPKGVLLVGPPGTGKTLLAKAIAGEANVPFFSISGSDFVEMFVGVGASRVRDMFEQGKRHAPCIIFIDEIDAVGRSRFSGIGGGHDEREQTLNALLVEMDGFDTKEGVIIIAATNRPDVLDPALLRPGRFDRQIFVDLPNLEGREKILKIHARRLRLGPDADLRKIARGTAGFSGADLENLINEAALLAARRGAESIGPADLEEARDKVRWGRERRSRIPDEKERRLTAYHEAGHAVVLHVAGGEPLHKVTIIPRGQALGATMQLPERDRYTESRSKLLKMLQGLMGGRAAEELVFGDVTTGAQMDFRQATQLARLMVCEWGMSEELGPQTYAEREELLFLGREVSRTQTFSEETARRIDSEINRILREAYAGARRILTEHLDALHTVARELLARETLDGQDVADIVAGRYRPPEPPPLPPAALEPTPDASAPADAAGP